VLAVCTTAGCTPYFSSGIKEIVPNIVPASSCSHHILSAAAAAGGIDGAAELLEELKRCVYPAGGGAV
jgi:hypothetical protein